MKYQQTTKLRTFSTKDLAKITYPRIDMVKYDGRCTTVIKTATKIEFFTTGGKMFTLENSYPFNLSLLPEGAYFAELLGAGKEGKLGDRVHSAIQLTFVTRSKKGLPNLETPKWKLFDYVKLEDYERGVSASVFSERFKLLESCVPIDCMPLHIISSSIEDSNSFHHSVTSKGFEGTVSLAYNQVWKASKSRPHTQLKRKDLNTLDLKVSEEVEGTGKYVGMIGALICEDKAGDKICTVGSGLTDGQRDCWGLFKGKIVEVSYEQILDKKLIQPTFKGIREDKNEPD